MSKICKVGPRTIASSGWCGAAWFPSSLAGVAFPSVFAWCCLPPPPLGGTTFLPSSVGWCCLVSFLGGVFCWVVLLGPLLLGVVLRPALSPPPLGDVTFPISFQVVLPSSCHPLMPHRQRPFHHNMLQHECLPQAAVPPISISRWPGLVLLANAAEHKRQQHPDHLGTVV